MKLLVFIFVIILSTVIGQMVLSIKNLCKCYQFQNETECILFTPYCRWDVSSQGVGLCSQNQCSNFTSQADCVQLINCVWNGKYCSQFSMSQDNTLICSDLTATSTLSCQQQNRGCFGTQGQCVSQYQLPNCTSYTTQQTCKFGQQGKCSWSGKGCYFYENCSQIPATICSTFQPFETKTPKGQYCYVNGTGICVQSSCSVLTTESTCTYVQTIFNQDQFILCSWNSQNNTCSQAISTQNLTQENCLTNTLANYRWITYNNQTTDGLCFQCQFNLNSQSNQCLCDQLISELDCINAKACTWQLNKCLPTQCTTIITQQICASSSACMWIFGKGCQPFTKCSDLYGVNQFQCLAQSTQCSNSNGIYCTQQQNTLKNIQYFCQTISSQYLCNNAIIQSAFCVWNSYYQQCTFQPECYQLQIDRCEMHKHLCIWQNNSYCQQATSCQTFLNENECTYYYNLNYHMEPIIYCQWDSKLRQCIQRDPSNLSQNDCYIKSQGQYRWSSQVNKVGTCLQCSSALLPDIKKQCECNQLIYQGDCAFDSESCIWNFNLGQCVNLDCTTYRTRSTCIANYNCHWIQRDNIMQCLPFQNCDKLPGNNSYQCMLYSFRCTSSDGQYCKDLSYTNTNNTCSSINNYTNCYLNVARDGVCRWNGSTQQCYSLQECNQIPVADLCGINNYACYWNYVIEQCQPVSCDMVTTESECTYFDKTIGNTPSIQMCLWNQTCINATSAQDLNSADCFVNSARTHYWSTNNETEGTCKSCLSSFILASFISLVIEIII